MGRKSITACTAILLALVALTGCSSAADSASVVVEVRATTPGDQSGPYAVKIMGPADELVASFESKVGSTTAVDEVPFGWVSVEASPRCSVATELSSDSPTMRLIIDGETCTLAD